MSDQPGCDCSICVADNLRDRIAAVLLPDLEYAYAYNPGPQSPEDWANNLADAVIAELGLREEHRERSHGNWPNQPQVIYRKQRRYISEWENDD